MILENRAGNNRVVESRTDFGSSTPPTWAMMNGNISPTGHIITPNVAITVPTIVGALQLVSGTVAQLPLIIYEFLGDHKSPIYTTWQYELMETFPGPYTDPFQLKYDIAWCLEMYGNAFILKVKNTGRNKSKQPISELVVLDPERVQIENVGGEKKFNIRIGTNQIYKGATISEILHIKNMPKPGTMFTGTCGLKVISNRLGVEVSTTEWEGRFFMNNATPPLVITLGEDAGVDEMKEAYDSWQVAHAGVLNAGKPAILGNGAKIEKLGFNNNELQLIESHNFNVLEFARAMNLPVTMFVPPHTKPQSAEDEALMFATFYLSPRLRRIESAFNSDPDFFAYNDYWMRFDERAMQRANTTAMAQANHSYVQDGVLLVDEVRAELGYDPLPPVPTGEMAVQNPGKIPQLTPVGGAPTDTIAKDIEIVKQVKSGD
ncbi:MAG TPA: phage portal protein, partial [Candidatus Paceibacterota bacterium]